MYILLHVPDRQCNSLCSMTSDFHFNSGILLRSVSSCVEWPRLCVKASVTIVASIILSVVCLSRVRCKKLSEIGAKFHCLCRKSGLPSKNMTSDFAPEVAKYPKSSPKLQNSPKLGSQSLSECVSLSFHSVSSAVCLIINVQLLIYYEFITACGSCYVQCMEARLLPAPSPLIDNI